ncbi:uncharacterized protein VP01_6108g2, partial [Puccinia sorghi]
GCQRIFHEGSSLFEANNIHVCIQNILNTLHNHLNMTQKTTRTVHPNQDAEEHATNINQITDITVASLVYTDFETCDYCCRKIVICNFLFLAP